MNQQRGWEIKKVGDSVQNISLTGRKLPKRDYLETGKYPVIDQGQDYIGGFTNQADFVISETSPIIVFGDHTRAIKYVDFPFVAGADGIKALKPHEFFYPKLFYYFLQAIELPDKGYARHYQYLSKSDIPLPPFPEQKRIVDRIESLFTQLDAGMAELKRAQAALKRYRASVLKAACEGRLVPQDPNDEPAEELLKRILAEKGENSNKNQAPDDHQPELPPGWAWVYLRDISLRVTDGTHQPPKFTSSGIPFIFVKHVVGGKITFKNTKFISEETYNRLQARCPVEFGDVIYTAVGSYGVAIPVETTDRFSFQRHIAHIKPSKEVYYKYLSFCLNSEICLSQAHKVARGVAQKTVTLGDLSKFLIPLPPISEQFRIVKDIEMRLSVTDNLNEVVSKNIIRAERLCQAILKRAIEGRLAPQDPNDEPASALLKRIQAEKEQSNFSTVMQTANRKVAKSIRAKRTNAKQLELFNEEGGK